ncbi:MAG: ABC transporter ATP-binding protein, partial [Deltaproteobacteria bacterium]|nr:ABC transporter ATP-binding protein [Deltaproteobacteria bacterium]
VALARAIVRTPTVFLMDEPLSNLDAKLRVTMRAELKHLQHELKITTVYVTHDQIEAMTLADRVAVMDHGIISQLGPPEKIYNDPANLFVAGFIGSPPMNLMKGKLNYNNFQHPNFSISINHKANLEVATLGIRPEDLILCSAQKGVLQGTVYAHELTGESTLTTINVGPDRLTIRGPKEFKINIDEVVGVQFEASKCFLFSNQTGERI